MTHDQLQAKYSLVGPVAGSVVMVPYSGKSTNEILCHYSKCLGSPWPAALPGVNDGAACQKNVWVVSGGYNGVKASNVVDLLLLDETPPRVVTATNYPVRAEGMLYLCKPLVSIASIVLPPRNVWNTTG